MLTKKMIFLGTAAAECYPNPFCSCPSCQEARESSDSKLKRRRSSFLIDEESIIDFGSDIISAVNEYGICLANLKNVFLTHMHEDHFDYWNIAFLQMSVTDVKPLNIYMSQEAYNGINGIAKLGKLSVHKQMAQQINDMEKFAKFVVLEPYNTYEIDNLKVTPVIGNHNSFFKDERSLNYIFENDKYGKFMYASDTGRFKVQTMEFLANQNLDTLIIEGSFGKTELLEDSGHLYCQSLIETIGALKNNSCINANTKIYVTHIGHKGIYNHYDYEKVLQGILGNNIIIAYDGLEI